MSDIQQSEEKKAPTKLHIFGVSVLMAFLIPSTLVVINKAFDINQYLFCAVTIFIFALLGAFIGVSMPKSIKGKWIGLWSGAVVGTLLFFVIANSMYHF